MQDSHSTPYEGPFEDDDASDSSTGLEDNDDASTNDSSCHLSYGVREPAAKTPYLDMPAMTTTRVPPSGRARVVSRPLSPQSAGSSRWEDSSDDKESVESYAGDSGSSRSCGKTR